LALNIRWLVVLYHKGNHEEEETTHEKEKGQAQENRVGLAEMTITHWMASAKTFK